MSELALLEGFVFNFGVAVRKLQDLRLRQRCCANPETQSPKFGYRSPRPLKTLNTKKIIRKPYSLVPNGVWVQGVHIGRLNAAVDIIALKFAVTVRSPSLGCVQGSWL